VSSGLEFSHFGFVFKQVKTRRRVISGSICCFYGDTLIERLRRLGLGCRIFDQFYGCLLYADDILLLSHSVNAMRCMLMVCDQFAAEFDMKYNSGKSSFENW